MLSQLFLISTILLVGITTVSIGAPVAETTEIIQSVKFPQMGSDNHTMNRRFIEGIPGLPQCPDPTYHILVYSDCLSPKLISALCDFRGNLHSPKEFLIPCPDDTTCKNFKALPGVTKDPKFLNFAICVDDEHVESYGNNRKEGVFCKTFKLDGVTEKTVTLSIDIDDGTQNPAPVRGISFTAGSQSGSQQNTNSLSNIINSFNGQKVKTCFDVAFSGLVLFASFAFLDGSYSSS